MKLPGLASNKIPKEDVRSSSNETLVFFEEIKELVGGIASIASLQKCQHLLEESLVQEKEKLKRLETIVQGNTENTARLLSDNAKTLQALQHLEVIVRLLASKNNETPKQHSYCADRGQSPVQIMLSVPSEHCSREGSHGGGNGGSSGSGNSGTDNGNDSSGSDGNIGKEIKEQLAKLRAEMDSYKQDVSSTVMDLSQKLRELESQTVHTRKSVTEMMGAMHGVNEYVKAQFKVKQDCPDPYSKIDNKCLYLENYRKRSFSEARKYCQEKAAELNGDGDLAVLQDMYEFMSYITRSEKAKTVTWLWIGAYREDWNSPWKWVTEDVVSKEHFVWDEQEPSNLEEENAICFQMTSLLFHNCESDLAANFVCEFVNKGSEQ
ncbi:uncharacterized protein LOC143028206 isoform X2 [Oratosquilla oratoria]